MSRVPLGILLAILSLWLIECTSAVDPAAAASKADRAAKAAAERCRQLAAAWLGDRPGVEFEKIDPTAAVPACEQAVKKNPKDADLKAHLCRALRKAETDDEALIQCQLAAKAGSPAGMWSLGGMYANGRLVDQDEAQAVAWYQKAAELGFAPAQNSLGVKYANGSGVEQDDAQAVAWYRKAAEQEYPPAQNNLGVVYAMGSGVEKDEAQAVAWYLKVIERKGAGAWIRREAAKALGELKDLRAVEPLIAALRDADSDVRWAAAEALGKLRDSKAIKPLIAALRDANEGVRWAVIEALGESRDPQLVEPLLAALNDADAGVRQAAAAALGKFQDSKAIEFLIAALRDADPDVRQTAAEALGALQDLRAVEPLITALRDVDKDVRFAAAKALEKQQYPRAVEPLITTLRDADEAVRRAAVKVLGQLRDSQAVEPLITTLHDAGAGVRQATAEALGELGDLRAVEPLIAALRDADPDVRQTAAEALGALQDLRAVEPLITALRDVDKDVRFAAAKALEKQQDPRAVEPLLAVLRNADKGIRLIVASVLGELRDPQVVGSLVTILPDADGEVRQAAALALRHQQEYLRRQGKLHRLPELQDEIRQAIEPLITTLHDTNGDVRRAAAWLLGQSRDPRVVGPLIATLRDSNEFVRGAAAAALGELQNPQAVEPLIAIALRDNHHVRRTAAEALGKLRDPKVVEKFITALHDANADIRGAAAAALGQLRDSRAVEPLIAALRDADEVVRREAAAALGQWQDPRAVEPLIAALRDADPDVGQAAAAALGQLRDPRAVEPLIAAALSENLKAFFALQNFNDPCMVEPLIVALRDAGTAARQAEYFWVQDELEDPRSNADDLRDGVKRGAEEVICSAIETLGQLKDPRVVEPLIAAVQQYPRGHCSDTTMVLANFQDPRAVETLIANIDDVASDDFDSAYQISAKTKIIKELVASTPLGLADNRVATIMHSFPPRDRLIFLESAPRYTRTVFDLIHVTTAASAYPLKLNALSVLWNWNGSRTAVTETVLTVDLAATDTGVGHDAVAANPYLALFLAQIHQENGRSTAALEWIDRAQQHLPAHETAPRIVAGWIQAQALRQAGQTEPALAVITCIEQELLPRLAGIEQELLPRLAGIERRQSQLPFESQTLALKGVLLGDLDQRRRAVDAFYAAEDALQQEQQREWIAGTTAQRVRLVIAGHHAPLLQAEGKAKAQQALDLSEQTPPSSRLEQEAELKALVARLKAALGDGDYELAQQLGERLALKHQPMPGQILAANPARQAHYQQLQSRQQQIQQHLREQDAAEQAARQAKDEQELKKKQAELAEAKKRGQQARRELKQFLVQLKTEHPEVAALIGAEPTDLRHWQARLQPHQRLVQYLLLEDQGWAFVAAADTLEVVNLPVGRGPLRDLIERYRRLLQTPAPIRGLTVYRQGAAPDTATTLGQHLRQHLLEPLRPHLTGVTHLLLVPNGPLHQLPFAALPWDDDRFLVQRFQLSTLSSPSLLAALNAPPPAAPPQLVALGNPIAAGWSPLPAAEQEVRTIATLFTPPAPEPALYLREQAQRNRLIGQDLNGKVLHLAVHGQAGTLDDTRLILSDGPLTVGEVWGLALERAPLVVLSACETALGEQLGGDEVVSLANGFIFAGAQAVVSSLWPVPDPPTRELMEAFYRQRDQNPAAALAAAQRALIQAGHAPYHWAGFVVAGW